MHDRQKRNFSPFSFILNLIENKPLSDRLLLRGLFLIALVSLLFVIISTSIKYAAPQPVTGGVLREGILGTPRFVNPVLAVTHADQDTSTLIYNGLMKLDPEGNLVPDLAKKVTVSADGLTYNIEMREDIFWHDDTPITARDFIYTVSLIQNAELKSPQRGNWSGVTTEELGPHELNIILSEAYTPFIENLTQGILPRHLWENLSISQIPFSQLNTNPVGSGPFLVNKIVRNKQGLVDSYELKKFPAYYEDVVMSGVTLKYYPDEDSLVSAFRKGDIMSTIYLPPATLNELATNPNYQPLTEPLPRIFAIFFNQNRSPALRDHSARQALNAAVNRDKLIQKALNGQGIPLASPLPNYQEELAEKENPVDILLSNGWTQKNGVWEKVIDNNTETLTVNIKTANLPMFQAVAESIAEDWRSLDVVVQIDTYEQTDLLQSVIRGRDFQALLFGLDMTRDIDLYPFWHSSQRDDPGLNITQYANITADGLLRDIQKTQDPEIREQKITEVITIINEDLPAIFLFMPTTTYVLESNITPTNFSKINKSSERFMNINQWYLATDIVWPIFHL